ncbi:U-box domain-containing protein [Nemania abortiva]|nr:U-box domain-containing protein [Nemania abortiva]
MKTEELPDYPMEEEEDLPPYSAVETTKEEDSDIELTKSTSTLKSDGDEPDVTIHPLESGVLVKVQPPVQPSNQIKDHIPCDIVLVIDVSASMSDKAPAPANGEQENATKEDCGLTILDLTKHAARTIVSTLNEGDRLGIVTFGNVAKVVQDLTPMTKICKEESNTKIERMVADGCTNLWGGISKGLKLFDTKDVGGRVPALMVLTDGQPNHQCPGRGYVNKLRSMGPLPAIINTFGFGYEIKSGLLKCIAETSDGNYAFIPDAGMIGTVFVHAVAHLQTTYATRCTLILEAPGDMLLKTTTGKSIGELQCESGSKTIRIQLGNLQYGQSRDIYLENVDGSGQPKKIELSEKDRIMHATLEFYRMRPDQYVTWADHDMIERSPLSRSVIAYHQSRSIICELLSSFYSIESLEYKTMSPEHIPKFRERLQQVIGTIPAREHNDPYNRSIMEDLKGQITEALSRKDYFNRWGCHFLLSLWNAHAKQLCNSFKDPGPLKYNDNKFFIRCRDILDDAFDSIPPPVPFRPSSGSGSGHRSMKTYNDSSTRCFSATSTVRLATGCEVPVCTLRQGMEVQTPAGPRRVRAVLKSQVHGIPMCRVGDLLVTSWHPIRTDKSGQSAWVFPIYVAEQIVEYSGIICSVLLEPSQDVDAHAIWVGGVWGVTLGHGILSGSDVRAHQFFGNYNAVLEELMALGPGEHGVYYNSAGSRRDPDTGLVCGFKDLPSAHARNMAGTMDQGKLDHGLLEICV